MAHINEKTLDHIADMLHDIERSTILSTLIETRGDVTEAIEQLLSRKSGEYSSLSSSSSSNNPSLNVYENASAPVMELASSSADQELLEFTGADGLYRRSPVLELDLSSAEQELLEFTGADQHTVIGWFHEAGGDLITAKENFLRNNLDFDRKDATLPSVSSHPLQVETWFVDGQRVESTEVNTNRVDSDANCPICMAPCGEDSDGKVLRLRSCHHTMCLPCAELYIRAEVDQGKLSLCCPISECKKELEQREIRAMIGDAAFMRHDRIVMEHTVSIDPTLHLCSSPDCTYVVSWCGPEDGLPVLNCPICRTSRCLLCRRPDHGTISCADATDDQALHNYIQSSNVKLCARCGNGVVKSSGCDKMKCRCGYRFCYSCGAENCVRDGEPCGCTPANHGYIDPVTGNGDFYSLRSGYTPT